MVTTNVITRLHSFESHNQYFHRFENLISHIPGLATTRLSHVSGAARARYFNNFQVLRTEYFI
jgi:hypothetical protein